MLNIAYISTTIGVPIFIKTRRVAESVQAAVQTYYLGE